DCGCKMQVGTQCQRHLVVCGDRRKPYLEFEHGFDGVLRVSRRESRQARISDKLDDFSALPGDCLLACGIETLKESGHLFVARSLKSLRKTCQVEEHNDP